MLRQDDPERIEFLSPLDAALLWSMRAWALGLSRGIATGDEIARLFADLGVPEAAAVLDGMMGALNRGARRMLEVNCVCHPAVSEDERDLLEMLALQRQGRQAEAVALLRPMLAAPEAEMAARCAGWLMAMLAGRGMPVAAVPGRASRCLH